MENRDRRRYIPKYLNASPHILWWEIDEALIILFFLIGGVMSDHIILMLILGAAVSFIYTKIKNHKQDGYFSHLFYFLGLRTLRSNRINKNKFPKYYQNIFRK